MRRRTDPDLGILKSGKSAASCLYMLRNDGGTFVGGNTEKARPARQDGGLNEYTTGGAFAVSGRTMSLPVVLHRPVQRQHTYFDSKWDARDMDPADKI